MKSAGAIIDRIERACANSGRDPGTVRLLGASKKQPIERINEFVTFMNQRHVTALLGENYVQEALEKKPLLRGDFEFHCIGHLQSNKAAAAAEIFDCVQTVDSERLARALAARALKSGKPVRIFIQVNVSDDNAKSGISAAEAPALAAAVSGIPGIALEGLMTIPRLYDSPSDARRDYRMLRELSGCVNLERCELSMGMSDDFEIAIEEGATIVRVGSALFGDRA